MTLSAGELIAIIVVCGRVLEALIVTWKGGTPPPITAEGLQAQLTALNSHVMTLQQNALPPAVQAKLVASASNVETRIG